MTNPLLEASLVRSGARVAFRHDGTVVDPITGQLLFDFERLEQGYGPSASSEALLLRKPGINGPRGVQELFLAAVQAEEAGEKIRAIKLYEQIMELNPSFAPAWINLGTIHFHLREFDWAEQLYRRATEIDPGLRAGVLRSGQRAGRVAAAGRVDCRLPAGGCAGSPLRRRPLQPGAGL